MSCMAERPTKMSFHPSQDSQNRVDAIKKKFEDAEQKPEKPVIKRTPAFRCDRIVCGKNVTNITTKITANATKKPTWASVQSDSEAKVSPPASENKFPKSFSENTLANGRKNDLKIKFISHQKNIMGTSSEISLALPQYSVVNKKKTIPEDKLCLALQSPLPTGPPPKKPPRIFTHTPQKEAKQDARLKLEKLENFILKHEKSSHVISPRKLDDVKKSDSGSEQCGLASLSCLSECVIDVDSVYVKKMDSSAVNGDINGKNATKMLDLDLSRTNIKKDVNLNGSDNVNSHREPIYAQPFKHEGNGSSFETFGKKSPPSFTPSPPLTNKTDQPLHYMCTDLTQPVDWQQANQRTETSIKPSQAAINNDPFRSSVTSTPNSVVQSAIGSLSKSLLTTSLSLPASKPSRVAPAVPQTTCVRSKRVDNAKRPPPLHIPPRKTSSNCSSPPSLSPSHSPLGDVRKLMDKAFRVDPISWDSDDASGQTTPEDTPSLDYSAEIKNNGDYSPASSPSLNSISSQTDDEALSRLASKRKNYVKRVSSHLLAADRLACIQSQREQGTTNGHLFESCLLIGLTLADGTNGQKLSLPYVKSYFPPDVAPPPLIESLCFPDADTWPPHLERCRGKEQVYSIVLTNERGERKFGYCRRVLPEGSDMCLPLAYCIISPHRATGFYYTVLQELESRHGTPELETLMKQLYENEFPNPGQSLKLNKILERAKANSPLRSSPSYDTVPSTLVRRPEDVRLENWDVTQLFCHFDIPVFLKLFSSVLLERKIIILGSSLSSLSGCIEGLQSILYPFSWQHTYVPVLPSHLMGLCEAPTPYIIGVLKHDSVEAHLVQQFSEGIIVDLEESRIVYSCKDEATILPSKLRKGLRSALTAATNADSTTNLPDSDKNVLVSEAFLRFFVEVCGHYEHHIIPQSDGTRVFQKKSFISAVSSASIQTFLEWFTETALFHTFIKDRVEYDVHDLFWKRSIQHSHTESSSRARGGTKKVKTLGDRIKDLTTFNK